MRLVHECSSIFVNTKFLEKAIAWMMMIKLLWRHVFQMQFQKTMKYWLISTIGSSQHFEKLIMSKKIHLLIMV